MIQQSHFWEYIQKIQNYNSNKQTNKAYTSMFMEALFTAAKTWKQPKCPSTDEWIKKMWYTYTMKYYSVTNKEWNNVICNNLDGPRDYHTKWSKSDRERQISYDITYMWTLKKWCKSTYLQSRNRLIDIASEFMITKGERGGGIN